MQSDPYELSTVEVRRSEIEGAEEGLFATRDIILGKEARGLETEPQFILYFLIQRT